MNKVVVKLKSGDFKIVNTSYNIPVSYNYVRELQSGVERGRGSANSTRHSGKHSVHRGNGS